MLKSIGCSHRGVRHPHGGSQSSTTPAVGDLAPSSGLCWHQHAHDIHSGQNKQTLKIESCLALCLPPSLGSLPDLCFLWDWSNHCVSFPQFLGKVSSPSWSRSCPLSTPAPTGCIFPLSAFLLTSPLHRVLSPWKVTLCGQEFSVSWTSVPASSAGPGCPIMCRMGIAWTPGKGTEDSSFGHLCPWKACNGELGGEGTKSEPVPLQPTCQISPGHSFPPPIPTASLCLVLLIATSCPRVCGEQSRGIPGPESEEVPQQAGRMQEYAYARRCSKFQFPQPALCRAHQGN